MNLLLLDVLPKRHNPEYEERDDQQPENASDDHHSTTPAKEIALVHHANPV